MGYADFVGTAVAVAGRGATEDCCFALVAVAVGALVGLEDILEVAGLGTWRFAF